MTPARILPAIGRAAGRWISGVDGPIYNLGRSEGRSDVIAEVRRILDPGDAHHWNADGVMSEIKRLARTAC